MRFNLDGGTITIKQNGRPTCPIPGMYFEYFNVFFSRQNNTEINVSDEKTKTVNKRVLSPMRVLHSRV